MKIHPVTVAVIAVGVLTAVVFAAAACDTTTARPAVADTVECDRGDLAERDTDCGYWDAGGMFWLWYWVDPRTGGISPYGWHPSVPAGGSSARPSNANRKARPKVQPSPAPPPRPPATGARKSALRPPAATARKPAPPPAYRPPAPRPAPPRPAPPRPAPPRTGK